MKLAGGVLAIILLVFVPLVTKVCIDEIGITRENWNTLENYIDIVKDKGLLTKEDYDDFVLKLSSNGIIYDIEIEISRKIALPESEGTSKIIYQPIGYYSSFPDKNYQVLNNTKLLYKGDIATVICTPANQTVGQVILSKLLKVNKNNTTLSLSGMVRNNGME